VSRISAPAEERGDRAGAEDARRPAGGEEGEAACRGRCGGRARLSRQQETAGAGRGPDWVAGDVPALCFGRNCVGVLQAQSIIRRNYVPLDFVESVPPVNETPSLVDRARHGDPLAFEELVRPHLPAIRRFALSFCRNPTDADDLAQDALVKAFRSFGTFDGRAALSTWLYTVARSTFLDSRRSRLFRARGREDEFDDTASDSERPPEGLLEERQQAERLWDAIRALPPKFRVPLLLSDVEGMSYAEIAEIEHVPIGTVRSRISRARDHLADALSRPSIVPERSDAHLGTQAPLASSNTQRRGAR
jgi:RNA polymerase sigma-70 factor (ECF subfamily)